MGQTRLSHHGTPHKALLLFALLVLLGCSLFTNTATLPTTNKVINKRPQSTANPTSAPVPTSQPVIGIYLPYVAEGMPTVQTVEDASALTSSAPHPADYLSGNSSPGLHSFGGLDFQDFSQRIRIKIIPPDKKVNRGKPIIISFRPGLKCRYEDDKACVYTYPGAGQSMVTMITVHSGVGGDAQSFRHAIEGTGVNRAGFSLRKVRANLAALDGAEVVITQGEKSYHGFTLVATTRLPAEDVLPYFNEPVENALAYAAAVDLRLNELLNEHQPLILFETCGWRMPGEKWVRGLPNTSGAVYIGVIKVPP